MICPRCQNEQVKYFFKGSKGWMCRRCVQFKRQLLMEEKDVDNIQEIEIETAEYTLPFPLTRQQQEISNQCARLVENSDVFIEAICGAGKTELVVLSIARALKAGKKVGFAIARRQVVLELQARLSLIFSKAKVIAVCQGYTEELWGDLIVCTTHQLYRYPNYFDLLIIDEPDAFPYKGNPILHGIVQSSCKGKKIYLTATPDEELKQRVKEKAIEHLQLFKRPHQCDLIVPKKVVGPIVVLMFQLIRWIKMHHNQQILLFMPTIKSTIWMKKFLAIFLHCEVCHSKTEKKDEIIQCFKQKKIQCLISTTILERGITIENIHVCVFFAHHGVFDEASLTQMSGRVGRSFNYPTGDCLFLCTQQSQSVDACIAQCRRANDV